MNMGLYVYKKFMERFFFFLIQGFLLDRRNEELGMMVGGIFLSVFHTSGLLEADNDFVFFL